jgi:hypothetical protein
MEKLILIIGSHDACESHVAGFSEQRLIQPHLYASYTPPPDIFLSQVGLVYVHDVENHLRLKQLEACCRYLRRCGGIKWVFGLSRRFANLQEPANRELARKVLDAGAQIFPQSDEA